MKKMLVCMVCLVLAAGAVFGLTACGDEEAVTTVTEEAQQETTAAQVEEVVQDEPALGHYYRYGLSFDGKTEVYEDGGKLYLKTEGGETVIAEGVEPLEDRGRIMAGSGNALIYWQAGALYHYNCGTGESVMLTDGAREARVSTNGEYVVYSKEDGLYLWDGESRKLAEGDLYPCSVSDDGLVYATGEGGEVNVSLDDTPMYYALYSFTKDGTKTLVKDGIHSSTLNLNRTQNQAVFAAYENEDTSHLYLSIDGAPAQILVRELSAAYPSAKFALGWSMMGYGGVYDLADLRGQIYQARTPMDLWEQSDRKCGETALIYVGRDGSSEVLLTYSGYSVNMKYERDRENRFIYALYTEPTENGNLYRIEVQSAEKVKLAERVEWFSPVGDGSVCYTDQDLTLWHLKEGNTEKIAENVSLKGDFLGTDDGVLYRDADGKLWLKKPNTEQALIAEAVEDIGYNGREYFYETDDGSMFYSADGEVFEAR